MPGGAGAIKAGQAFVELFVEDNKAYRALDAMGAKFKAWGKNLKNVGAALGAAGEGILRPLVRALQDAVSRGDLFGRLAANTGQSVAQLSRLADMAERAGASVDGFAADVDGLQQRARAAARANDYLDDGIRSLGLGAQFAGLSVAQQMERIAEVVRRTGHEADQAEIARRLFPRTFNEMLPILRGGAEAVRRWREEVGVSDEQAAQSVAVTRALADVWKTAKDAARELGFALLPTAAELANFRDQFKAGLTAVRDWIKENRGAILAAAGLGVGLTAAGVVLTGFGTVFAAVGAGIVATVAGVKLAFGALLSPLGLATAALAAGGAAGVYLASRTEEGRRALADMRDGVTAFAGRAREAFGAVSDAIGAGDWALAWRIGLAAMRAEWANFNLYLQVGWNLTKELFVDGWHRAVAGLKVMFTDLSAFIARNTVGALRDMLARLAAAVGRFNTDLGNRIGAAAGGLLSDAQIDAGRDALNAETLGEEARRQRDANAHRDAAGRAAAADLLAARAELAGLRDLARWRAEFAAMPWITEEGEDGAGGGGGINLAARLADAVKGIGGGSGIGSTISQQLAFGDTIPQQQLDAARSTASNTAQLPQMARDVNALARGGRVGP